MSSAGARKFGGRRGSQCTLSTYFDVSKISHRTPSWYGRIDAHSPTSSHQRQLRAFQLRQRRLKRTPCHNYPACALPDTLLRADKVAKCDFLAAQLLLFLTQLEMNRLAFVQIAVHHTPDFQRQLREESCLPLEVGARVELPVRDGSQADS